MEVPETNPDSAALAVLPNLIVKSVQAEATNAFKENEIEVIELPLTNP